MPVHAGRGGLAWAPSHAGTSRTAAARDQLAFHQKSLPHAHQEHLGRPVCALFFAHHLSRSPDPRLLPAGESQAVVELMVRVDASQRNTGEEKGSAESPPSIGP